ncbi:hypothetical protein JCM9140_561 [Halalkalibacter wakoensis JCM 9140]|uniref:Uncharacterized protein n=1 Tax=Halalkalibacter wakoensis JCM 9140 TaxID=1236970 RepID=W4PZS4_9BACI|nr:hypothetical protein [Halalkalibacter wakoensis]GAE24619.1 hypothetical protein JCM9140_561 [Halalkalibacter wakoensis JCM 9140]
MIVFFIAIPLIAYLSMVIFYSKKLGVENFEGKFVPYSLGVPILFSYGLFYVLYHGASSFSLGSVLFILLIWLLGFIDDIYGTPYPKGLKGHVMYALEEKVITTGLLKAVGTVVTALLYVPTVQTLTLISFMVSLFLLIGIPHVMNLFDTRPLRVWKVTVCFIMAALFVIPLPTIHSIIMLVALFGTWYFLEAYRKAMLGDNGATLVGAIMAVVSIHYFTPTTQFILLGIVFLFMLLAEKYSFSNIIENSSMLRVIDQWGVAKRQ